MIKRKFLISAAVGIGAMAALSGGVLAASNGHRGGPSEEVSNRVAEILGVDPTDLSDALSQARDEARDAAMAARLARLVEAGTITQAQADEVTAWYDSKPEALDGVYHGRGGLSDERLAALVEASAITQAEADEIATWRDSRPEVLDEIRPQGRGHGRHGRGHRGFGRGFGGSFSVPTPDGSNLQLIVPSVGGNSA